jgi:hypothetical protein
MKDLFSTISDDSQVIQMNPYAAGFGCFVGKRFTHRKQYKDKHNPKTDSGF